jgi:hypothetical protein
MSTISVQSAGQAAGARQSGTNASPRWIVNSWVDVLFIILTPLVAVPAILVLNSAWVGVGAATISLIVATFFAVGHHLPGLIRAYGDRELF